MPGHCCVPCVLLLDMLVTAGSKNNAILTKLIAEVQFARELNVGY